MKILRDTGLIAKLALEREDENYDFRSFLKGKDNKKVDVIVHRLNDEISAQIDCTQCGNCCRSMMVGIEKADAQRLSKHLNISVKDLKEKYVETSAEGNTKIFNKIPCHFLNENKCTVYAARPNDCREFPHLHKPGFTSRLFSVIDNYGRCPIVFNVFERLKEELRFAPGP